MRDYFHDQYKKSKQQKNKQHPDDEQESKDDFDYDNIKQKSKRSYADKIRRGDVLDLYLLVNIMMALMISPIELFI
ncbi:hypothetical protein B4070_4485 [Bacillus subtilis]|nr:hypothetical protein B4070_4485 [Bacillus subtilis]